MCVSFRGGFLHTRGYDPVLAVLLFSGALALHSRQLDLKLRLDYLWATQVCLLVYVAHLLLLMYINNKIVHHFGRAVWPFIKILKLILILKLLFMCM